MSPEIVKGMVEDYYRAIIPAMQQDNVALASEISERFEKRISETASQLDPLERAAFLQGIEGEREIALSNYQADPAAFKARLGIPLGKDAAPSTRSSNRQSMGEMAVRTAVRATIWESVWALFRSSR